MNSIHRVVMLGQSVFMTAIEAGLRALPQIDVIYTSPHRPDLMTMLETCRPDLVVIEKSGDHNNLIVALLDMGLPLIEVSSSLMKVKLLTSHNLPVSSFEDIAGLIENVRNDI